MAIKKYTIRTINNISGDTNGNVTISESPITVINTSSLFSTGLVGSGGGVTGVTSTNFFGVGAGYSATSASYSNFFGEYAGSGATYANNSNFLGRNAGNNATNVSNSNFLGYKAGLNLAFGNGCNFLGENTGAGGSNISFTNFLGTSAGYGALNSNDSNFLGQQAGYSATSASYSNFLGSGAGSLVVNAGFSNFFGINAGRSAANVTNSNFLGPSAGQGITGASYSNFFGASAGRGAAGATGASYSNLFGYRVGYASSQAQSIGSNNIIIGTNISLPSGIANSINIGGVLFGTGTYSATTGNPSIIGQTTGKIGVNVVSPTNTLHIKSQVADTSGLRLENLTSSSPTSTGQTLGIDLSGNVVTIVPVDSRPYKVYTALLTQTGTNAPTAVVLENTLGVTPTISYIQPGTYDFLIAGVYTLDKISVNGNANSNVGVGGVFIYEGGKYGASFADPTETNLQITTWTDDNVSHELDLTNNLLYRSFFEIRVYN